jgi:hypothetical protein
MLWLGDGERSRMEWHKWRFGEACLIVTEYLRKSSRVQLG